MIYTLEEYQKRCPDKPYFIRSSEDKNKYLVFHGYDSGVGLYSLDYMPGNPCVCDELGGDKFIDKLMQQTGAALERVLISEVLTNGNP